MATSQWIIEPTTETFERDVLERSHTVPVIVDFWAPWCGPCRALTPVLEKLVDELDGRVLLAKVNTEAEPQLAAAFQVQSIPMVVAIREGQLVDGFLGAQAEEVIREFLGRLIPSPAEEQFRQGNALEPHDPNAAETHYREALIHDAEYAEARIALARLLIQQNRLNEAQAELDRLSQRGFLEPEAERLLSQLHVRQTATESGGVTAAEEAVRQHPDDAGLKVKLAEALAAEGRVHEGLDLCLEVVRQDRAGVGVQAKEAMVDILKTLDDADLASDYRRKLATLLY